MLNLNYIDNLIFQGLKLVSDDKYKEAEQIIDSLQSDKNIVSTLNTDHWQYIADIYLTIGKYDLAQMAYIKANNSCGIAFTLILQNKLEEASNILTKSKSKIKSPAISWCTFLIELFSCQKHISKWPSFLLIRNFLEFTFYHLLLSKNAEYMNLILNNLNKFHETNLDSEKLIGYAYFHFGDNERALQLLNNALKRNQFDGEIYFVLAQVYLKMNSLQESMTMLENAKLFLGEHYPTFSLIEQVKSLLSDSQ